MEPVSNSKNTPYDCISANLRARLARMLGVPGPGQERSYPGARPPYGEVMADFLRLASEVGAHYDSCVHWIIRDPLLGRAMPRRRGDKAQFEGVPSKRKPETVLRARDAYRHST